VFREKRRSERHTSFRGVTEFHPYFHIYSLLCVRDLRTLLLIICEFRAKSEQGSPYFLFFFYSSTALYGPGPPRFVEVS
jgi:hypothetical protein